MKFLDYDGPLLGFLSRVADLIILNLLSIIFSIPIITLGASITATHYTALKIRRGEGHVWSNFWKSFKENLKQSTVIWLILLVHFVLAGLALALLPNMDGTMGTVLQYVVMIALILSSFLYAWVFPLQSKFVNDVKTTFVNAFYFAFKHFPRTLLMVVLNILPMGLLVVSLFFFLLQGFGIWLVFGVSLPIYWCAMLYDKVFEKLEDMILEQEENKEEIQI